MKNADIDRVDVEKIFSDLESDIKLILFTRESNCPSCSKTRDIVMELTDITRKVDVEIFNFNINKEKVAEYKVTGVPAIVPLGERDYGIRYYGPPTNMEFRYFLQNLVDVSRGTTEISDAHRRRLSAIQTPLHVQLFIHGECVFGVDVMRHLGRIAVESDAISVDFIDPLEFPELTKKYHIRGVPFAVINETMHFYAAMSEDEILEQLEKAAR